MSDTSFTAFFGDGEQTFRLTPAMVIELERVTGAGIGTLFQRLANLAFYASDLVEIIRLGLVGGGMAPEMAKRLVDAYAVDRPISEVRPIAWGILRALWFGPAPAESDIVSHLPEPEPASDGEADREAELERAWEAHRAARADA